MPPPMSDARLPITPRVDASQAEVLQALGRRHDEALAELDLLNQRIEDALANCSAATDDDLSGRSC